MKPGCKYLFLIIIQLVGCVHSYSQVKPQLRFFHLGIEQGLSNSSVNCLLQDKTGFIWVGTENGLNRYDGYQFVLVGGGNDKNTMGSAQIVSLLEDLDGMIWIGTRTGGLHRYDPKTGIILQFLNTDTSKILSDNFVRKICMDHAGILWLGTPNGLTRFNPKTFETKIFRNIPGDKNSLVDNDIRAFCNAKKTNNIWVGTYNNSLCLLDPAMEKFKCYPYCGWNSYHPQSPNTKNISALYEDDSNRLRIGGYGLEIGEYLNTLTDSFTILHINRFLGNVTNEFIRDDKGRYWAGGWEGLGLFDPHFNFLGFYKPENGDPFTLANRYISSMIKDRNGVIWLGTKGGGLHYFHPFSENFLVLGKRGNESNSLSSNLTQSIFKDAKGTLWIGNRFGLDTGRIESGRFKIFQRFPSAEITGPLPQVAPKTIVAGNKFYRVNGNGKRYLVDGRDGSFTLAAGDKTIPFPYKDENIKACITDKIGNVWVGDFGGWMYRINHSNGDINIFSIYRTEYLNYFKSYMSYGGCNDIFEDKKGKLWFATERGLDMYNPATKMFTNYKIDYTDTAFLTNSQSINFIEKVTEDSYGNIWVGTNKAGVCRLDITTKTFTRYKVPGMDNNSNLTHVISLYIAKNGIVYAGTESGGIIVINPENNMVSNINTTNGIPDNSIAGILEDSSGHIWISTYNGLCEYAPRGKQANSPQGVLRIFTTADGLPSNEFSKGGYFKDADGRMYFGNTSGVVSFVPEELGQQTIVSPLVLTDIQLFNRSLMPGDSTGILAQSIGTTELIKLKYNQNIITLNFAALSFINAANIKYSYRLTGFNNEWFTAKQGERSVTYTSLQPGTYVFEVKAINGISEGKITSLSIIVTPPFWKTIWFIALMSALVIGCISLFFRWRLNRAILENKKQHEIEAKISELKLAALRSQMNPHFIFNSLNSIQHYIHSNQREAAESFLSTFALLIRQILDNSAHSFIPLADELRTIGLYLKLEKDRFGRQFNYEIRVEEHLDMENIMVPSMLIQPYIENAILHGLSPKDQGGFVEISIKKEPGFIVCLVTDNGVGRQKAAAIKRLKKAAKKSYGMSITKARLDLLNQHLNIPVVVKVVDLFDEQNEPGGTEVEICMPLQERF